MNFNFLNPFFSPEMISPGFNPAAPNPFTGLTPIGPGPTTAGMPVPTVDLLADQLTGGAPDLSMYPAGGMSRSPMRPGMSFEAMTGQPEPQMSYGAPLGPTVADVAPSSTQVWGERLKKLGGMQSEPGARPRAPMLAPPPAGGGGRAFDVTPFLRQPVLRRGK